MIWIKWRLFWKNLPLYFVWSRAIIWEIWQENSNVWLSCFLYVLVNERDLLKFCSYTFISNMLHERDGGSMECTGCYISCHVLYLVIRYWQLFSNIFFSSLSILTIWGGSFSSCNGSVSSSCDTLKVWVSLSSS